MIKLKINPISFILLFIVFLILSYMLAFLSAILDAKDLGSLIYLSIHGLPTLCIAFFLKIAIMDNIEIT